MDKQYRPRKGQRIAVHCSFVYNGEGLMGEGTV